MASMAKALSAIRPASMATISRVPGKRLPLGRMAVSNGMAELLAQARAPCKRKEMDAGAKTQVRLIGLPTDSHSSFLRGPAEAPAAIRAALASDHMNMAAESGEDIHLDDAGDLPLDESADDVALIRDAASSAARDGQAPLFLGGDHMVSFP